MTTTVEIKDSEYDQFNREARDRGWLRVAFIDERIREGAHNIPVRRVDL